MQPIVTSVEHLTHDNLMSSFDRRCVPGWFVSVFLLSFTMLYNPRVVAQNRVHKFLQWKEVS
jgi:hypothetical protein